MGTWPHRGGLGGEPPAIRAVVQQQNAGLTFQRRGCDSLQPDDACSGKTDTRDRSSTGECWLGRPATRVRLPPVPRSSRSVVRLWRACAPSPTSANGLASRGEARSRLGRDRGGLGDELPGTPQRRVRFPSVARLGPGYVWRRWLTVYEYLGGFDSLQGRSVWFLGLVSGLVFQRQDAVLARRRWGFESPRVHDLFFASVADQLGTRLQPATTRCDSGQMLDTVDDPRRPRHADPVLLVDTLPWYGREEGSTPSVGSTHVTPPRTDATRVSEAW